MQIALVTGASSGIGRVVATELASRGFHVIAAGRARGRLDELVATIRSGGGSTEAASFDLAALESVRVAAASVVTAGRPIDVLVNNAGVAFARKLTADGFQPQFGTNHLGHFMLHSALEPVLHSEAIVVQVSSEAHRRARPADLDRVDRPSNHPVRAYAASKLANILFTREAARRHPSRRYRAVHPGMVDTGIWPLFARPLVRRSLLTPEEGADTVLWCTEEGGDRPSGGYFLRRTEVQPSQASLDDTLAAELWDRSEVWCSVASDAS